MSLLLLTGVLLSLGCTSLSYKVSAHLEDGEFEQALVLLEEADAGTDAAPNLDADALEARRVFQRTIEQQVGEHVERALAQGKSRAAQAEAVSARRLCEWSSLLAELERSTSARVRQIDELSARYRECCEDSNGLSLEDARKVTTDIAPVGSFLADSPQLALCYETASRVILRHWGREIGNHGCQLEKTAYAAFHEDLHTLPVPDDDSVLLASIVEILPVICSLETLDAGAAKLVTDLLTLVGETSRALDPDTLASSCFEGTYRCVERWLQTRFTEFARDDNVMFAAVELGERALSVYPGDRVLEVAVAGAHQTRARMYAAGGASALLGLLHVARSEALLDSQQSSSSSQLVRLRKQIEAAYAQAEKLAITIQAQVSSEVSPELQRFGQALLYHAIMSRSAETTKWIWRVKSQRRSAVEVTVESLALVMTSAQDLPQVHSSYFSHFQSVPNPRKASLRARVLAAERQLNSAKRSYDTAVGLHNIYPTQFSLNDANAAYNRYVSALNAYNTAVNVYNAAPSTIVEPVYLSYTFRQGIVEYGWRARFRVRVEDTAITLNKESIDRDFVRFGSRMTDKIKAYRKIDPLDIDVSAANGVRHLLSVFDRLCDAVRPHLCRIEHNFGSLAPPERKILSWLYHPWGVQPELALELSLPTWVVEASKDLDLKPRPVKIPQTKLVTANAVGATNDLESLVEAYEPFVCRVDSMAGHGSGTLVSTNGLILTCAHVLTVPPISVRFFEGDWKGRYEATSVFINEQKDVAILKADGLRTERCASIRLSQPGRKGEPILAIGNPSFGNGTVNTLGVSEGIVSNPRVNIGGMPRLAADISIASGSSGGPLISIKDGSIVGVVLSVIAPGIRQVEDGTSASGFSTLAAPADLLPKWLGLSEGTE